MYVKIKIGGVNFDQDWCCIDVVVVQLVGFLYFVVDVMNMYDVMIVYEVVDMFVLFGFWWFEDICDLFDLLFQVDVVM